MKGKMNSIMNWMGNVDWNIGAAQFTLEMGTLAEVILLLSIRRIISVASAVYQKLEVFQFRLKNVNWGIDAAHIALEMGMLT